jgi:hypothetical protein
MANAKQIEKYTAEVTQYLMPGEEIQGIYTQLIDYVCMTNKRILFVHKTWTSKKQAVVSVPFSKITAVSFVKGTGIISIRDEVEISVGSQNYEFQLFKEDNPVQFYNQLVQRIS